MIIEMIFIMGGRMGGYWNIDLPISANESEEPDKRQIIKDSLFKRSINISSRKHFYQRWN